MRQTPSTTDVTLADLAERLNGRLEGDADRVVRGVAPVETADRDELSFLANEKYHRHAAKTSAAVLLVGEDFDAPVADGTALIRCEDPYFAFREAMVAFYGFRRPRFAGIDARAAVSDEADVGDDVACGPFVTVEPGATIGPGCILYPGVYVGADCRIGRDCTLHANVVLYERTVLGDRVTVHAGSSVGQDGFGYATHGDADGTVRHEKIPQTGWVELEDDVEIGAGCAIDRATMGPTVIGAGTKFSNLVTIGHGTKLGRHCLLVAQAGLAGSVQVGDYCVFAGQCGVVGHIRIGDGARIGAQAGVTNDVPAGQEMLASPAIPLANARRSMVAFARLPELRRQVKRLTDEVSELKSRLDAGGGGS
ncbi:MAG: UDP-3-O-(3-hydroxymyristoyl)glucosamine N-acyltransferase [Phycisphaerae bacterium]|nr:UDP-3-O-(3-hydroxymyristoyl)glucosamine N-acyltransferase [Phycisphaerae bacterium]